MATFNSPVLDTLANQDNFFGKATFVAVRPDVNVVYTEYRTPGSLVAFYNSQGGYAELYVVDPSGYRFLALG